MPSSPAWNVGPCTGSRPRRPWGPEGDDAIVAGPSPCRREPTTLTAPRHHRGVTHMKLHRRSFLRLVSTAGTAAASAGLGLAAPAIVRAATPVKMTLPWLPLGTFSYTFVAKKMGFWDKRGLDVTIDRGFGSGRVCVQVEQGRCDIGILYIAVM